MPIESELGHTPVIPPRLVTDVPRVESRWLERFGTASVCDVSDAVGPLYTMSAAIGPLYGPTPTLVGRALTVKCWPGDNLAVHGALAIVQQGDVLVVDCRGYTGSCGSGAQVLEVPRRAGLRGIVIDGAWRDVDELQAVGLPVFGRARSAYSPPKRRPGEINVPVSCGGVVVHPGDLVVGDAEGVAVVPRRYIAQVWDALTARHDDSGEPDPDGSARARREYFDRLFAGAGGVVAEWAVPDAAKTAR